MKIALSTESTCDLPKSILEELGIFTIPFGVTIGDKSGSDGEITPTMIFESVTKTKKLPKTSAINEYAYEGYFQNILDKGYNEIIHITLSSALSVANSNANRVAEKYKNIRIIDSKSLSTGIGLLVLYANDLISKSLPLDEIENKLNSRKKDIQASFIIETLDYLYKGGRCNALAYLGANLLGIKPKIILTPEGKMTTGGKYRGKIEKAIKKYAEDTLNQCYGIDKSIAFVTYSSATEEMIVAAETVLKEAGFLRIIRSTAGATITSHCGPHTLGTLYFATTHQTK